MVIVSKFTTVRTTVLDNLSSSVEYVALGSGQSQGGSGKIKFEKSDEILKFRPEGRSLKGSRCFVIGYDCNHNKCYSKGISFGVISSLKLPPEVIDFEVHLRIVGGDRVWLHDVHWSGVSCAGSVGLAQSD